jgi:hypothetical protein
MAKQNRIRKERRRTASQSKTEQKLSGEDSHLYQGERE